MGNESTKEKSAGKDSVAAEPDSSAMANNPKKLSDFLTSSVFSVVVGDESPKTFRVHEALLRQESDRLAVDVDGGFQEAEHREIILDEEDPKLFGYFLEYLYRGGWIADEKGVNRDEDYIILARLYALGDRLQAGDFQRAALNKFYLSFSKASLSDQTTCELLEIAHGQLPKRVNEDPLRAQIFWYAALRLTRLHKYSNFLQLLDEHRDLGKDLILRAGDGSKPQPQHRKEQLPAKFEAESIY